MKRKLIGLAVGVVEGAMPGSSLGIAGLGGAIAGTVPLGHWVATSGGASRPGLSRKDGAEVDPTP